MDFEQEWKETHANAKASMNGKEIKASIKASFEHYAKLDKNNTMIFHGTGKYQCFCEKHSSVTSFWNDGDLCHDYVYTSYYGKLLGNIATILVVVFNIASRKTVIAMIEKIGLPTMSLFTASVF